MWQLVAKLVNKGWSIRRVPMAGPYTVLVTLYRGKSLLDVMQHPDYHDWAIVLCPASARVYVSRFGND